MDLTDSLVCLYIVDRENRREANREPVLLHVHRSFPDGDCIAGFPQSRTSGFGPVSQWRHLRSLHLFVLMLVIN